MLEILQTANAFIGRVNTQSPRTAATRQVSRCSLHVMTQYIHPVTNALGRDDWVTVRTHWVVKNSRIGRTQSRIPMQPSAERTVSVPSHGQTGRGVHHDAAQCRMHCVGTSSSRRDWVARDKCGTVQHRDTRQVRMRWVMIIPRSPRL